MNVAVRRATVDDAAAIGAVHLASWRAAYRDDAPAGFLAAQTLEGRTATWRERLGGGQPLIVLVAERAATPEVVGFASLATPSRDDDADEDTAQIPAFYVDTDHWRVGVGRALMDAAFSLLAGAGWESVTLWVLETNDRAHAFYMRSGFVPDGGRKPGGEGWPPEIRMRRAL